MDGSLCLAHGLANMQCRTEHRESKVCKTRMCCQSGLEESQTSSQRKWCEFSIAVTLMRHRLSAASLCVAACWTINKRSLSNSSVYSCQNGVVVLSEPRVCPQNCERHELLKPNTLFHNHPQPCAAHCPQSWHEAIHPSSRQPKLLKFKEHKSLVVLLTDDTSQR